MASFNKVMLMGNVTRDPQLKTLPSNTTVAEFGLAMNRRYKTQAGEDREEVAFVDCAAFGKQAQVLNQYCTKGKPLFIEGRLKFDTWEDRAGAKRSKLSVVIENFQFIGGRESGGATNLGPDFGSNEPEHRASRARPGQNTRTRQKPADLPFGEEKQFAEADIPF